MQSPRLTLTVSPCTYALVMMIFCFLHLGCGLFLFLNGQLYWYIDQPFMEYYANLLGDASNRHYAFWGFIFHCLCGLHVIEIILILLKVLILPAMVKLFPPKGRVQSLVHNTVKNIKRVQVLNGNVVYLRRILKLLSIKGTLIILRFFHETIQALFGRYGLLGIQGQYFDLVFLVREIFEIASQVYQTHRSSTLLARPLINNLLVALLVINCWTTPLLYWPLRKQPRVRRIVCVIVDTILCAIMVMVVPMVIFIPYTREFDTTYYLFNVEILYDDAKFAALTLENQSIFISSLIDGLSKVTPHLTIWSSMHVLRTVFVRCDTTKRRKKEEKARIAIGPQITSALWFTTGDIVPQGPTTKVMNNSSQRIVPENALSRQQTWSTNANLPHQIYGLDLYAIVSCLFGCVSVIVLYLHIAATLRTEAGSQLAHGCKQQISPWFAIKYTCAVYEFNCYREQVESPSATALDTLDASALVVLIFSHCTALVVPKSFETLTGLIGFEIYNSTIVKWSHDASINSQVHTRLGYTVLSHVNLTHFPEGFLVSLPDALQDIEIVKTNLTVLPDLDQYWHSLAVLYFEYSQFQEFPPSLTRMDIGDLSVVGNNITVIPVEAFRSDMEWLSFSYNPIQALPSSIATTTSIIFLGLEYTKISVLPDWISEYILQNVFVMGTPYCTHYTSASPLVNCEGVGNRTSTVRYPYELMASLRVP